MAAITDQRVIDLATDFVRQHALQRVHAYESAKEFISRFNSAMQGKVPNDLSSPLYDVNGAQDPSAPLWGADIWNIYSRATEFASDLEAGSNAKLDTLYRVIGM